MTVGRFFAFGTLALTVVALGIGEQTSLASSGIVTNVMTV